MDDREYSEEPQDTCDSVELSKVQIGYLKRPSYEERNETQIAAIRWGSLRTNSRSEKKGNVDEPLAGSARNRATSVFRAREREIALPLPVAHSASSCREYHLAKPLRRRALYCVARPSASAKRVSRKSHGPFRASPKCTCARPLIDLGTNTGPSGEKDTRALSLSLESSFDDPRARGPAERETLCAGSLSVSPKGTIPPSARHETRTNLPRRTRARARERAHKNVWFVGL